LQEIWLQQSHDAPWRGSVGMAAVFLPLTKQSHSHKFAETLVVSGGYGTFMQSPDQSVNGLWAFVNDGWKPVHSLSEVAPRAHQCLLAKAKNQKLTKNQFKKKKNKNQKLSKKQKCTKNEIGHHITF